MKDKLKNIIIYLLLIVLCFILLAVIGCTKTVYVPVQSTKIEYRDRLQYDSIQMYDSIYIKEVLKGDTIRLTEYKYKYMYRDKLVRDSVMINDTIRVPVPVERKLTKWQQTKMDVGGWAMGSLSVVILYIIVWLIRKFT